MKGIRLAEISYLEAKKVLNSETIVMLPLGGGSKEHGRHLPMGTDMYLCEALVDRVLEEADVVCLPTMKYEHFPAFIEWEGSVNIEARHYIEFVKDIIISLIENAGVKKFFLLDFSFSAYFPLVSVCNEINNHYNGVKVAVTKLSGLGVKARKEVCTSKQDGHAGEMETSMMLYTHPDLVHTDKYDEEYRETIPGMVEDGVEHFYMANRMETPHGVNGNPFEATAEKGKAILEDQAKDIINFLEQFKKIPYETY